MSSCMQYRVPLEDYGYTITNGRLGGPNEESDMEIGSREYPPIIITSYEGETTEEIYGRGAYEKVPKQTWKNLINGKSTGNWLLTYITINPTSIDFDFGYKDHAKERCTVTVYASEGMEIWLEVPREDELPPAKYLIDTYYDGSLENKRHIRVTEFYERMKRWISVKYDHDFNEFLHITEYRD